MRRPLILALLLAATAPLQGCLAFTAADMVGSVAALGVKTGVKVTGAAVGLATNSVSAAGRTVTGTHPKRKGKAATAG